MPSPDKHSLRDTYRKVDTVLTWMFLLFVRHNGIVPKQSPF